MACMGRLDMCRGLRFVIGIGGGGYVRALTLSNGMAAFRPTKT